MDVTLIESESCLVYQGSCARMFPSGMLVRVEGAQPPLLVPLRIRLSGLDDPAQEFGCEVVRYVTESEAASWGMDAGCMLRVELGARTNARAPEGWDSAVEESGTSANPKADPELRRLLGSGSAPEDDYYALLGLRPDTELSEARRRAVECRAKLEAAGGEGLGPADLALVEPAIGRVNQALSVLGDPVLRAEYDAAHANFHGVARCLQAGLSLSELESCRWRRLSRQPGAARLASSCFEAALALEQRGEQAEAVQSYERALAFDPLDLRLHLRYEQARRKLPARAACRAPSFIPNEG